MAHCLLSILMTTITFESILSIVSKILTQNRSCLLSKNVEALLCIQSWLNGFEDNLFLL